MWGIVLSIVMAIIIGLIGDALAGHEMPGGIAGSMIAGFVGAGSVSRCWETGVRSSVILQSFPPYSEPHYLCSCSDLCPGF